MIVYRGTDWLYHFEMTPVSDILFTVDEYDGWITDITNSMFGVGLYFYSDIDMTRDYQYSVTASIDDDIVEFSMSNFNEDSYSVEGSVYRLLQTHDAINNNTNRARFFKSCLEIVLNKDIKAVNVDGTIVVYDLNEITWDSIDVNENVLCVPYDPFK